MAGCAACQEALRVAREQQGLLAEAVKEPTAVVFKAPTHDTAVKEAPPTLVLPKPAEETGVRPPRRNVFLLNRWSIAAGILLALFSTGAVLGWTVWSDQATSLEKAQNRLAKAKSDLEKSQGDLQQKKIDNQKEIRAIQKQIDELFNDWKSKETETRKILEDKRVSILLKGPQVAQAGANNRYEVQVNTNDPRQQKILQQTQNQNQAPLQVKAVNQATKEVVFKQDIQLQADNKGKFELPPDMPIKPGEDIALFFHTLDDTGKIVELRDNLKLVFPEYVTHLTTDRPMYKPGDTVRYRSLTLERFSLKPPAQPFHIRYRIFDTLNREIPEASREVATQVVGADKKELKGPGGEALNGLGVGEFLLPAQLPSGQYTLAVSEVNDRFREEKRSFLVNHWQTPRFNKEVSFHRSSYGQGDQVRLTVRVTALQGGGPVRGGVGVTVSVEVDDQRIFNQNRGIENDGKAEFEFILPEIINRGNGVVTIRCDDGAGSDTIQRQIPIVVRNLEVEFFPEGGDLVAGVPNRVYLQVRTLAKRPADLEGRIIDDLGAEVARVQTLTDANEPGINQGLGAFTFTPQPKRRYFLRVDSPIGVDDAKPNARFSRFPLPSTKDRGVVLNVPQGVVEDNIDVTVHNAKDKRELLVGAYCRGRLLAHEFVNVNPGKSASVNLKPVANVSGVYRITVFEKLPANNEVAYRPLAERLIFRKTADRLDLRVTPDREHYLPGGAVRLSLSAQNDKKEYVPAVALLAVVDSSLLKLADEKTARTMPTHFLLTTEIRQPEDIEHADVLLGDHPKAVVALDLLLGCQGWRRFAEQDPQLFQRRQQQQAKPPIFVANSFAVPQFLNGEKTQIDQLDQGFVSKAVDLQRKLGEREKVEHGAPDQIEAIRVGEVSVNQSENEIARVEHEMLRLRAFLWQFGLGGGLLTLMFVGFYLISVGLRRLSDGDSSLIFFVLGFGLFALLFVASIIGTFVLMGERMLDMDDFRGFKPAPIAIADPGIEIVKDDAVPRIWALDEINIDDPLGQFVNEKDEPRPGNVRIFPGGLNGAVDNQFNRIQKQQRFILDKEKLNPDDDRVLRQKGDYQAILLKQVGRRVPLPPAHDPCVVREYAHQHKPQKDGVRRDFTDTVYWHPVLVCADGKADVKFDLSESLTRYQVLVLGHTGDGRLGATRTEIFTKVPFSVDPKTPIEVTQSDQIQIPVAINNNLPKPASINVAARVKNLEIVGPMDKNMDFAPKQSRRKTFEVRPGIIDGTASIRILGKSSNLVDAVERTFKIVPDGFPIVGSVGGVLENSVEHEITLPETWIPGSLKVQAQFYPSPIGELQSGLEAMLREPCGCFEQASSSNYPNVLILNYLRQANQANPIIEKQARTLMHSGYQQLTAFECTDPSTKDRRGYEWFGQTAPPHEALTAYGLLQFRDMAKVHPVDDAMLQRTEKYLLDQRDGKGGFKRNPRGLDQFGQAPDAVTNAYIVWALTESGVKANLDVELAALREEAKTARKNDPYFIALAALAHLNRQKSAEGVDLLQRLVQKAAGDVIGTESTSITGSQGRDLAIETTALSLLGWLKANRPDEFRERIQNSAKWLGQQRQAGGFGSTQATILGLKALIAYNQYNPRVVNGGNVQMVLRRTQPQRIDPGNPGPFAPGAPVAIDELPEANFASFTARSQETLNLFLHDASSMRPGKNTVQLTVTGANSLPYTVTWSYRTLKPANDPKAPVKIEAKLSHDRATEDDPVKLSATIENISGKGQGMAVAVIGIPAGLALPEDFRQLKDLAQQQDEGKKPGVISAFEVRGRELVLYWRDLAPDAKVQIDLNLIARLPGLYRGPASRAYLYYDAERRYWIEPLSIRVVEPE